MENCLNKNIELDQNQLEKWWMMEGRWIEEGMNEIKHDSTLSEDEIKTTLKEFSDKYNYSTKKEFLEKKRKSSKKSKITFDDLTKIKNRYHFIWGLYFKDVLRHQSLEDIPFPTVTSIEISTLDSFSKFPKIKPQKRFWSKDPKEYQPLYIDYFKKGEWDRDNRFDRFIFGKYVKKGSNWRILLQTVIDLYESCGDYTHCFLENLKLSDDGKTLFIECGS